MNDKKLNLIILLLGILVLVSIQPMIQSFRSIFSGISLSQSRAGFGLTNDSVWCNDFHDAYDYWQGLWDGRVDMVDVQGYTSSMKYFRTVADANGCTFLQ